MRHRAAFLLIAAAAACGRSAEAPDAAALVALPWDSVESLAQGTTVTWRMWRGDPSINAYVNDWVAPRLRDRFGITLRAVDGQGQAIINQLVTEREARAHGSADLVWINGETFHNLRRENLLAGPWADRLPNAMHVDSASEIVMRDFEQELGGWESPWGRVQFALIHDSARTPDPPRSYAALADWIRRNPGRFTHDQSFAGVTFLKGLMYALGGGVGAFRGGFDEDLYAAAADSVFAWLEALEPLFWRGGETYPQGVAELHRLFANGEIDFTMSNNHNEAVTKVRQGLLPATARPLLLTDGTIANAHHLGIPYNAPNPAGAMVVANFLLSPEAQLEKHRPAVWGDGSVLAIDMLPAEWRDAFRSLEADARALPADSLAKYSLPEVSPVYHERLLEDWRRRMRDR